MRFYNFFNWCFCFNFRLFSHWNLMVWPWLCLFKHWTFVKYWWDCNFLSYYIDLMSFCFQSQLIIVWIILFTHSNRNNKILMRSLHIGSLGHFWDMTISRKNLFCKQSQTLSVYYNFTECSCLTRPTNKEWEIVKELVHK